MDNSLIIMENETAVADQVAGHLQDSFTVHKRNSDDEVLDTLKESTVQLILIGQGSTDLQGSGFISTLKDDYPEIMRVLIAAEGDSEGAVESVNNGLVHTVLSKPVDLSALDKIVADGLLNYEKMDEIKNQILQANKDVTDKVKAVVAQAKEIEHQKIQLEQDLDRTQKELGTALAEKGRYEKKLKQFQANWARVVEGKG